MEKEKIKSEKSRGRYTAFPSGKYNVSCSDVLLGCGIEGTFFRLFYPADLSNVDERQKEWMTYFLEWEYIKSVIHNILVGGFLPFSMPAAKIIYKLQNSCKAPITWESPILEGKFPVVIFSHGFGSNRTLNTGLCSDLASHGFIVAAIEHRDRSANTTFYINEEGVKVWLPNKYVFVKIKEREKLTFWANMLFRVNELKKLLNILEALNDGTSSQENLLKSNFDHFSLKGKMDFDNAIISGFSIGAMSAMMTFAMEESRFRCGFMLDPYMRDIHHLNEANKYLDAKEVKRVRELLEKVKDLPMIYVLNDRFHDKESAEAFKIINPDKNALWTLLKSQHIYHSDFPMILKSDPEYLRQLCLSNEPITAERHHTLTVNLILGFFEKHLDSSIRLKYDKNFVEQNTEWVKNEVIATCPPRDESVYAVRASLPLPSSFLTTPKKFWQAISTIYREYMNY